ncbi:MAG: hypothetical protein AAFO07_05435 [Bacteroidota bacterium]
MALLKFFKVPKHQRFDYKPRYWDREKEEREERMSRLEKLKESGVDASKARIAGSFRKSYKSDGRGRKGQVMRSNLMLFGVILILLLITVMMMREYMPQIVDFIE